MSKENGIVLWPKNWPEYHNANVDACDMAVGPCACGATHEDGEFEMVGSYLYRCGKDTGYRLWSVNQ